MLCVQQWQPQRGLVVSLSGSGNRGGRCRRRHLGQEQFWEAMDILTPEPSIHVNGEKAIEVACRQCEHKASAGKNGVDIGVRPPVGRRHCGYRNSPCRVMRSVTPRWSTPPLSYATGRSAARCESSSPALRALEAEGQATLFGHQAAQRHQESVLSAPYARTIIADSK